MEPEGLQELIDGLADRLQRSVAIDDPGIHLIVTSRHFGDEDPVRIQSVLGRAVDLTIAGKILSLGIERAQEPQHIPAMPEFNLKPRVCIPIRYGGLLLGFLWLIMDENLKPDQITEASATAGAAAMLLYRRDMALEQRQMRRETLLRDLVSSDEVNRKRAEGELFEEGLLDEGMHVTVMVGYVPRPDSDAGAFDSERVETAIAQAGRSARQVPAHRTVLGFTGRHRLVLALTGRADWPEPAITTVAKTAVESVSGAAGSRMVVGIGARQVRTSDAHRSYEQALIGARAAEFLPDLGDVVRWEALGVYGLLANLAPQDLSLTGYPPPLLKLAGARNGQMLLATAEVFLDCAGDVQRAADSLHIHRSTLYQRIGRVEEVCGLRLSEGLDRLTLHLGIKLARLTGDQDFFPTGR